MKNIFKKNQIIITALAIMIAIAGYLNFSGRNDEDKNADFESGEVLDYETLTDDNILESDALELTDDGLVDETDVDTDDAEAADETAASDEDALVVDEDQTDVADDADSSEEVAQLDVSDTGEVVVDKDADVAKSDEDAKAEDSKEDKETSTPGEAILVSTTIEPNFFASAKLAREQTRAKNKDLFMEILNNDNISEKERDAAVNGIINLTADAEKENATETLLEAKGFSDAIVDITDGNVDVIINAASVTEQDIAQVEDIVKRKTGAKSMDIHISAVVVQE